MSYDWLLLLIPFALLVGFGPILMEAIRASNKPLPKQIVRAKVVDEATDVSTSFINGRTETRHSATFELEDGGRKTFFVNYEEARALAVGDVGELQYADSRFVAFRREPDAELHRPIIDSYNSNDQPQIGGGPTWQQPQQNQ